MRRWRPRDIVGARVERDWGVAELELALRELADCPVCALARQSEEAIVSWLLHTTIRDPDTVDRLVAGRGLCASHWSSVWVRADASFTRSASRVLRRLSEAVLEDLARNAPREISCLACAAGRRRAHDALDLVAEMARRPEGVRALQGSFGLCQPHLAAASRRADPETFAELATLQRGQVEALARSLMEAGLEPERSAPAARRLARKLAGAPHPGGSASEG